MHTATLIAATWTALAILTAAGYSATRRAAKRAAAAMCPCGTCQR